MPVTRRYYDNPTKPKRCLAMIPGEDNDSTAVKCKDRIYYGGLCNRHYTDREKYRENRRKTVTRHRLGIDIDGNVSYGTIDPSTEVHYCHSIKCRKVPIININDVLYCEKCFMRMQKTHQLTSKVNETNIDSNRLEGNNDDKGRIDSVV
jgi:hypothetical protein